MSRREDAKQFNRARICEAAEYIIRSEGMDKLTMRRLAEHAGVSLRTPYNLFGSKTDVLIALVENASAGAEQATLRFSNGSSISNLLGTLDRLEAFFDQDEEYHRSIYESIMSSDHPQARATAVGRRVDMCCEMTQQALTNGIIDEKTDTDSLGQHLAIELLAVLGMWGSGLLSNRKCFAQVRRSWCAALLQHCSETSRPALTAAYRAAIETKD